MNRLVLIREKLLKAARLHCAQLAAVRHCHSA